MTIKQAPDLQGMADRLKKARVDAGYPDATAVSRALGWSPKRYYTYESARASVPYGSLYELAQLFHTTTDALLGMPDPDPSEDAKPASDVMTVYRGLSPEASPEDILLAIQVLQTRLVAKLAPSVPHSEGNVQDH